MMVFVVGPWWAVRHSFFVAASVPLSRWLIAECEFVNPCQVVFTVSLPQSDPWSPSACTVCPQLFRNNQYRFSTLLKFSSEIRVIFQKSRTSFWTSPVVIFGSSVTRKWSLALDRSIRILQLGIEKKKFENNMARGLDTVDRLRYTSPSLCTRFHCQNLRNS
jgi:hypothetical protein